MVKPKPRTRPAKKPDDFGFRQIDQIEKEEERLRSIIDDFFNL